MAKILIVEDEPDLAEGLKDNLEYEGYGCMIVNDGDKAEDAAISGKPDLIVLDVMLPHKSGFDVCKNLRANKINVPIIMLTAKSQEIDKILGLELGADDYMTKPFSVRELLARIRAALRRKEEFAAPGTPEREEVEIGNLKILFDKYSAWDSNGEIAMTTKEIDLLKYLYLNQGKIITKEELMENVWGYSYQGNSRTVDNYIAKVRKKIEPDPGKPIHLFTLYGNGYRLIL